MFFRRRRFGFRRRTFRRRTFRRRSAGRFKRRGRRTNAYTAQRGSARALGFRGRRISRGAWKRGLVRSTQFKAHYRSVGVNVIGPFVTGTTQGVSIPLFVYGVGWAQTPDQFWTIGGGLQQYDAGIGAPTFQDDLIIRGGRVGLHLSLLDGVTDTVAVRVWWISTVKNSLASAVFPAAFGTQPWGWDPSVFVNFDRLIGKVIHTHETLLGPDNHYCTFEIKHPVKKANQVDWAQGGPQIGCVVQTTNLTSTSNISLSAVGTWNLSFSGDVNAPNPLLAAPQPLGFTQRTRRVVQAQSSGSEVTMQEAQSARKSSRH